jgi:hypothetical protein
MVVASRELKPIRFTDLDRALFVWLLSLPIDPASNHYRQVPETMIRWHRCEYPTYWRRKSRLRGGRQRIDTEVRKTKPFDISKREFWEAF